MSSLDNNLVPVYGRKEDGRRYDDRYPNFSLEKRRMGNPSDVFGFYVEKENIGKRIKSSKVRVAWKFCCLPRLALHEVELKHSVMRGLRLPCLRRISIDGSLVFSNKEALNGDFVHEFMLEGHLHQLSIRYSVDHTYYDLKVDGVPFHKLSRISADQMEELRAGVKSSSNNALNGMGDGNKNKNKLSAASAIASAASSASDDLGITRLDCNEFGGESAAKLLNLKPEPSTTTTESTYGNWNDVYTPGYDTTGGSLFDSGSSMSTVMNGGNVPHGNSLNLNMNTADYSQSPAGFNASFDRYGKVDRNDFGINSMSQSSSFQNDAFEVRKSIHDSQPNMSNYSLPAQSVYLTPNRRDTMTMNGMPYQSQQPWMQSQSYRTYGDSNAQTFIQTRVDAPNFNGGSQNHVVPREGSNAMSSGAFDMVPYSGSGIPSGHGKPQVSGFIGNPSGMYHQPSMQNSSTAYNMDYWRSAAQNPKLEMAWQPQPVAHGPPQQQSSQYPFRATEYTM